MKKVICDTNFLLVPAQFKVDVFTGVEELMNEPYEMCVMEGTMKELVKLAEGRSRDSAAAKLGFVLAEQKGLKRLPCSKHVDDAIVDIVDEGVIVCTQDKELKKRVLRKGGKIITTRQKHRLVFEG